MYSQYSLVGTNRNNENYPIKLCLIGSLVKTSLRIDPLH